MAKRGPQGGSVLAAAPSLFACSAAAQVSGTVIAESGDDFSLPHDVVLSPDGSFLNIDLFFAPVPDVAALLV